MQVLNADLREYFIGGPKHTPTTRVVITTNGFVKKSGECVMGRGTALAAARRWPELPKILGTLILNLGNKTFYLPEYKIYTLPVKHNWWERADLELIRSSCKSLAEQILAEEMPYLQVMMPKPGCGNGQLTWQEVEPIVQETLAGLVQIVEL